MILTLLLDSIEPSREDRVFWVVTEFAPWRDYRSTSRALLSERNVCRCAYNAIGEACEAADASCDRGDLVGRWRAIAHAARDWARAYPHEYALIYGTPVPGYRAPIDTIDPASRLTQLLLSLMADIDNAGKPVRVEAPLPLGLEGQLTKTLQRTGLNMSSGTLLAGIAAWTNLFGMISFEVFGRFDTIFDDTDSLFAHQIDLAADTLGLLR